VVVALVERRCEKTTMMGDVWRQSLRLNGIVWLLSLELKTRTKIVDRNKRELYIRVAF